MLSTAAGESTWVTTQSAHVAVARMQHVSQEMISDVALFAMKLPRSLGTVSGSAFHDHRKGVSHDRQVQQIAAPNQ
jgi:hypothetical protein